MLALQYRQAIRENIDAEALQRPALLIARFEPLVQAARLEERIWPSRPSSMRAHNANVNSNTPPAIDAAIWLSWRVFFARTGPNFAPKR